MIRKHDEHNEGQRCTLSALGDSPLDPGGFCDMTAPQACRVSSRGMTAAVSSLSNAPLHLRATLTVCLTQQLLHALSAKPWQSPVTSMDSQSVRQHYGFSLHGGKLHGCWALVNLVRALRS